jgi:hypothetical protein
MDAFNAITDALGGVWVDVPFEINDTVLPGHLDAGYQCLSGEQAQIFVRSRHAYDDLGDGDRYRAAHQRLFLSAMLGQLMSASVSTMVDVIDQVADYVETDLTVEQIVSLAMAMRGIDTEEDVYSTMNPTTATYTNGVWYEISNDAYWKEIMAQVDSGQKPDVDYNYLSVTDDINNPDHTSSGTDGDAAAEAADAVVETEPTYVSDAVVAVKNASGDAEKAAAVLAELQGGGWNAQDGGTANSQVNTTAVVYENAAFAADAQAVADAVGGYAVEAGDTWLISSGDIMVVVGAN